MTILLTYAPAAAARATVLAERLEALGLSVRSAPAPPRLGWRDKRRFAASIGQARSVLVLWSANAPSALRAIAQKANRAGKLVLARLDAAKLPLRAPYADVRADHPRSLRALQDALTGDAVMTSPSRTTRIEGFAVVLLFALVTATAAYIANASFAAQVNAAALGARTFAIDLIDGIRG